MKMKRLKRLLPVLVIVTFSAALFLVWREVRPFGIAGMLHAIAAIPSRRLALAALTGAGSYGMLTLFDWLALRYAGHPLSWPRAAFVSFVALAVGHTVGLAPLGSGALRARYYAKWGLDAEAIGKVILFCAVTVTLGEIALAAIVLIAEPNPAASWLHIGNNDVRLVGVICAATIGLYWWAAARLRRPLKVRRWQFALPTLRLAVAQVLVGALNFALLTATLHFLILTEQPLPYLTTAAIYLLASVAALVSHVPAGLGVTEFVILSFLPGAATWGALIVFRIIYYITPLALGGALLGLGEFLPMRPTRPARPAPALRR